MIPLWKIPQSELTLAEKDIHVWRADLDLPMIGFQNLYQTLSIDEKKRAERFHFEKDRRHFIAGRGILRAILGCYLGVEPILLEFCYGKYGKPQLSDTFGNATIHFNMSRSKGLALYAFTRDQELGVDVEHIRDIPEMEQIAERFFSPKENAAFRTLRERTKKEAFFNCWTRKEALLKAKGQGLALGLDQCEVSLGLGERAALIRTNNPQETAHWLLQKLNPGSRFIAALAVQERGWQLQCLQWEEPNHVGGKENDTRYLTPCRFERPYWAGQAIRSNEGSTGF